MAAKRTPTQVAASLKVQIKEVDDSIIGETIGIAQAIDEIQKASKKLMGYRDDLLPIAFGKNQVLDFQNSPKDPKSIPSNKAATFEALQRAYNSTEMTP